MPPAPETLRVYCAGPLFNQSERTEMTEIADVLNNAGYPVYLPHRDGMEFRLILEELIGFGWDAPTAAQFLHSAIFALDVYQLVVECDCMVWNLNGRTPDEGAVSEAAMAWTLGKPLVAYRDDVRSLIVGRVNPLLVGMVDFETVDTISAVPEALGRALLSQEVPQVDVEALPEKMRRAVRDGAVLWETLVDSGACSENLRIAEVVARLFAPDEQDALRTNP